MEVILREDVPQLGQRGDLVKVKPGYARNYLIPRKLAMLATAGARKQVVDMKAANARKDAREKSGAESLAAQLGELTLTISAKAGEQDQLFGSVTTMDIAAALEKEGITLDKRQISIEEPIKTLGIYTVPVKLAPEVTATLKVWVVRE